MSIERTATAATPPSTPAHPSTSRAPAPDGLAQAFARELAGARKDGRPGEPLRQPWLSAHARKEGGDLPRSLALPHGDAMPPEQAPQPVDGRRAKSRGGLEDMALAERREEEPATPSLLTFAMPGATPAPTVAAPPPSAPLDPSAFADLMMRLWLRERDRGSREVRVSFGDSAWPATGARLTRLADGSLSVTVTVGERRRDLGDLDALRRALCDRGLAIADLGVEAA